MKEKLGIIFSTAIFVFIIAGMFYINLFKQKTNKEVFSEITLEGNEILPAKDYLVESDLNKVVEYPELTLQEIRARIVNHPYVAKAEVKSDGSGKVEIRIHEKVFMAVMLTRKDPYLIAQDFEITPLKMNTDISNYPVISNVSIPEKKVKNLKTDELVRAFKIIDAVKMVNEKMYQNLAEINLRYGGDVILSFAGNRCPVIFGKGLEGKKVVILSSTWDGFNSGDKLFKNKSYVDLRFNNEIFIGKPLNTEANG